MFIGDSTINNNQTNVHWAEKFLCAIFNLNYMKRLGMLFYFPPQGQVILLLTISQSVSPSWPRAPNYDSWL